ncbi:MAG TPA: TetR/AcrR family transcriptional regulator [Actinomycetes bacterium]|jgi:AcrR family transcriptional regulator|nr:TetR/AcrR family transcriptional regulator [Actinomycetes bacterium]
MTIPANARAGVRNRTRRAILGAAASVLARDRSATLADIAEAAEVGRSTLHRYFPDREGLLEAVVEDSLETLDRAVAEAALDQGPPLEAMRRLFTAMVEVGDRILFLFGDPRVLEGRQDPEPSDRPVIELIERGQAEGVFDRQVGAGWIEHVLWALVYTAAEEAANGRLPRHGVTATAIRTFEHGIRAGGSLP